MSEPHLHCCIVSYQRRDLTERTLESWLETVTLRHSIVIADNGSTEETQEWLRTLDVPVLFLDENYYPGYATNRGWEQAPAETTLLQRSDNDTLYLPGWDEGLLELFAVHRIGQVGLWAKGDEGYIAVPNWPVGGNSIIRREIYDEGLRYTEVPWPELEVIEEHQLTIDIWERGYERRWMPHPGIEYLSGGDPEYYRQSFADRGETWWQESDGS